MKSPAQEAQNGVGIASIAERGRDTIVSLGNTIIRHQELYDAGAPTITDAEYDALVERLRRLAPKSPVLRHLGAPVGKRKVPHTWPMLSLAKCYSTDDVIDWCVDAGVDMFQIAPKYDGVSLSLIYDEGRLVEAVTRGDGKVGDSVLANVLKMVIVPKVLDEPLSCVVRGEAIFAKTVWERVKPSFEERAQHRNGSVNARNAAAGTLQAKRPQAIAVSHLDFIAYDCLTLGNTRHASLGDAMRHLMRKFSTGLVWTTPVQSAMHYLGVATEYALECDYETDGVVVKVDSYAARERLGATSHHPRWAMALKFQGGTGTTTLRDVVWQVSRTGTITPVAVIDPIELSGASITRATLHNLRQLEALQLHAGAEVEITRRGGVIPHIERRVSPASDNPIGGLSKCPCCKGPAKRRRDFLYCVNLTECPDVQRQRLLFWATQTDMMGWGEEVIATLYNDGDVIQPSELYRLPITTMIAFFGKVLGPKLSAEAELKSTMPAPVFLRALGIDGIGTSQSEKIMGRFDHSITALLDWARCVPLVELAIPGIGDRLEDNLRGGLRELRREITSLLKVVTIIAPARSAVTAGPFAGKKIVFTGKLCDIEREAARAAVREHGAETPAGVTKQTDMLVVGDLAKGEQRSKRDKAEAYISIGIPIRIVTEPEFLAMLVEATELAAAQ